MICDVVDGESCLKTDGNPCVRKIHEALKADGFCMARGSHFDKKTGWPKRIVHVDTGVEFALIPKGNHPFENWGAWNLMDKFRVEETYYLAESRVTKETWHLIMGQDVPYDRHVRPTRGLWERKTAGHPHHHVAFHPFVPVDWIEWAGW